MRFFVRTTIDKAGGEVDGLTSFGIELLETRAVGTADTVNSREEAKEITRVEDSIEDLDTVSEFYTWVFQGLNSEIRKK